jgi:hypothetical protein
MTTTDLPESIFDVPEFLEQFATTEEMDAIQDLWARTLEKALRYDALIAGIRREYEGRGE